jgi:hypothetical protein
LLIQTWGKQFVESSGKSKQKRGGIVPASFLFNSAFFSEVLAFLKAAAFKKKSAAGPAGDGNGQACNHGDQQRD